MFKKIIIYGFAFIGILSVLLLVIDFAKQNNAAKRYLRNCKNVRPGMNLRDVKLIMEDFEVSDRYKGTIWENFDKDSAKTYILSYPTTFGASTGTEIYFDPTTNRVTQTVCGE